jgi:hypothetical protein
MSTNGGLPGARINPNSWLARRFQPKPPDAITCGVRVIDGGVEGEGERWSYRTSAVDRLPANGYITLTHGKTQLRLARFEPVHERARTGYQVWTADEIGGAHVQVATPPNQAWRLDVE